MRDSSAPRLTQKRQVRLTEDEDNFCEEQGQGNASAFIRGLIRKAMKQPAAKTAADGLSRLEIEKLIHDTVNKLLINTTEKPATEREHQDYTQIAHKQVKSLLLLGDEEEDE